MEIKPAAIRSICCDIDLSRVSWISKFAHRGLYEIYINEGKSETKWQPRPADVELEAEMLRRLMVRLGTDEIRAATLVDKAAAPQRAKLTRASDGAGTLIVEESFDRAWRRLRTFACRRF